MFDHSACTGLSRRFAFAQFVDIPKARQFLELYYPTLTVHDNSQETGPESMRVRIAYSKDARERDGKGEDDWKCEIVRSYSFLYQIDRFADNPSVISPTSPTECFVFDAMPLVLVSSVDCTTWKSLTCCQARR